MLSLPWPVVVVVVVVVVEGEDATPVAKDQEDWNTFPAILLH